MVAAIQTLALTVLVLRLGAMQRLVSAYLVPHRHSMTLRSTYRFHRQKLVIWCSSTRPITLEHTSLM